MPSPGKNTPLKQTASSGFEWPSSSRISPFQFQGTEQGAVWSITEKRSSLELVREGEAMQHCVGDIEYANACYAGKSTIWSLGCDDGTGRENLLTIEVDTQENNITEVRGYDNRLPNSNEISILKMWSLENLITDTGNLMGNSRSDVRL